MRKYELTYLVSDEVQESDLNKVTGRVSGLIGELGGKVDKEDVWGRRKLIYPILKQDFATYITLFFNLPAEKAIEFEKDLRHVSGVIRQLLIVREYGEEDKSLTAEEIAETAEIEKVVGGEKSFEAVEGMTEESRDLMAKREERGTKDEEQAEAEELVQPAETSAEQAEEPVEEEPHSAEASLGEEEEAPAKPKAKKEAKKKAAAKAEETEAEEEVIKPKAKPKKESSDEAERLSKLNDELDDILKDEL